MSFPSPPVLHPDGQEAQADTGCSDCPLSRPGTDAPVVGPPRAVARPGTLADLCAVARDAAQQSSRLRRVLYRYERDAAEVDDIIQDALLAALEHLPSFRGDSTVKAWFTGILLNVARRHVKTASQLAARLDSLDALTEDGSVTPVMVSSVDRSDDLASALEMAGLAKRCIDAFSPALRSTFVRVCLEGNTYEAIAAEQNVPIGTIRSRINRARKLLRQAMGHDAETTA